MIVIGRFPYHCPNQENPMDRHSLCSTARITPWFGQIPVTQHWLCSISARTANSTAEIRAFVALMGTRMQPCRHWCPTESPANKHRNPPNYIDSVIIEHSMCSEWAELTQHPIAICRMSLITDNGNRYQMPDMICTMPSITKIMPNGTYRHISAACLWHLLHEHMFIESFRWALLLLLYLAFAIDDKWIERNVRSLIPWSGSLSLFLSRLEEKSLRSGFVMVEWTLQSTTLDLLFFFSTI